MNTTTSRSTGDGDRRTRLLQRTLGNQTVQHLQEGGDLADALAIGPAADSDEREAE